MKKVPGAKIAEGALQTSRRWVPVTAPATNGITGYAHEGSTLTVQCDFAQGTKAKGELLYDFRYGDKVGTTVDMTDGEIRVDLSVPAGLAGPAKAPNGVQIAVTDSNGRSQYSTWQNLRTGDMTVTYRPTEKDRQGYTDEGFDPSRIVDMKVKFALAI